MHFTIDLPPDVHTRLSAEAAKIGIDPALYIRNTLTEHLQDSSDDSELSEAQLLEKINLGLPAKRWQRFHDLVALREAETLTAQELEELKQLSEQIEQYNAQRLQLLTQLAKLRGVTLPQIMQQLGIQPAR